jgi:glycosyltransferase involved in cell wall biosynthesis
MKPLAADIDSPAEACSAPTDAPSAPDPRIDSALAWCRARRVRRLTLAAPFNLDRATLAFIREQPEILAIVRWPGQEDAGSVEMSGLFLPDDYTWELPPGCPATLVFIDGPGALTARMITAALRRGVRTVVFTEGGAWCSKPLALLALDKLWSKLVAACVSASGPRGGLCQSLLDVGYRRSIRPALAAAPLAFSAQRLAESATTRDAPAGIVLACPTLVAGGAERQIVNTATGLRAAGLHPITVLVSRLHTPPGNAFFLDQLLAAGVDVREVRAAETGLQRWLDIRRLAQTPEGARTLALLQQLPQAIRQEVLDLGAEIASLNPAVVHCWLDYSNVRAGIAAVCAGVPRVVLSGRNVSPRHFPYIFEPFMRSAYRALLDCPGVVVSNNSLGGGEDYAKWLGIDPATIQVIYNGIDLSRLRRPSPAQLAQFRLDHGIAANAPLIGGMFRLSAEKRPRLWLEVAAHVLRTDPTAHFVLFGTGPLAPTTQAFIDSRGLGAHIRLLPPTPHSDLALSAFDLLLLTSEWEGTPNVAIEAQALGTLVVLTGGGGASEALIDGETGCFVRQPDAPTIADAVLRLVRDPSRRERYAHVAAQYARTRFGAERMLAETLRLYGLDANGAMQAVEKTPASGTRPSEVG